MLLRSHHWRLAVLALTAAMLLVVMPTLTSVLTQASAHSAHVAMPPGSDSDAAAAMATMAPHANAHATTRRTPPGTGHGGHDDGRCAYCPLLAGLLQWEATPPAFARWMPRASQPMRELPPRVSVPLATLGARGPPA